MHEFETVEIDPKKVIRDAGDAAYLIPMKCFTPPNGAWEWDFYSTPDKDLADKAQLLLDRGCVFTAEPLRMIGMVSFAVEGLQQFEEGEEPETTDLAIEVCRPDPERVVAAVRTLIMGLQVPEDGVVRPWQKKKP